MKNQALINITEHNHGPDFEKNRVMFGVQHVDRQVEETSESPRDIIHNSFDGFSNSELFMIPSIKSITDKINKVRSARHRESIPPQSDIPMSIRNLSFDEVFLQLDSGIDDPNRIVVFCTDKNLFHLQGGKVLLTDETFKYCPNRFKQLYTLDFPEWRICSIGLCFDEF
jgi:hypothetical protein